MRFLVFLIFVTSVSNSQIKAVTENGDEVVLYDDKSWKFINENINNEFDSSKNYPVFYHDENSTFLLKSNINDVGVMIDPKKWSFNKSSTDDSEFEFELKNSYQNCLTIIKEFESKNGDLRYQLYPCFIINGEESVSDGWDEDIFIEQINEGTWLI